ncbi:PilZ domain-containing protein [Thermodesulfatator indicus]
MFLVDRRRSPRYCCQLPVYIDEKNLSLFLCDLSLTGCFIETLPKNLIPIGEKITLILSLPCVGPIPIDGIIRHHGTPERVGMGIEFLSFHDGLHRVYAKFVKILPILEEARNLYREIADKDY